MLVSLLLSHTPADICVPSPNGLNHVYKRIKHNMYLMVGTWGEKNSVLCVMRDFCLFFSLSGCLTRPNGTVVCCCSPPNTEFMFSAWTKCRNDAISTSAHTVSLMYLSVVAAKFICYSPAEWKGEIGLFVVFFSVLHPSHFSYTSSIHVLSQVFPQMLINHFQFGGLDLHKTIQS